MKRRSTKIDMKFCMICVLSLVVILMIVYIILNNINQKKEENKTTIQTDVLTTTSYVDGNGYGNGYMNSYDYYNFLPRRLFRNFYDDYYDYREYRERPQYVIKQDTKPIYINIPQQQQPTITQPAQQNNLNLYNYPEPKPQIPTTPPSIEPPPLSGVSPSMSENTNTEVNI
jgi:hypothetical protein